MPEVRKLQRRAAVGSFLRHDIEKELEASALAHGLQSQPATSNEPALTVRDTARHRRFLVAQRDEVATAADRAESLVLPAKRQVGRSH